jgi:hypothetical protein
VGGGRVSREGDGGRIRLMSFTYMYEDRALKPVEIILSKGEGSERE